jgi:hypothetical protein
MSAMKSEAQVVRAVFKRTLVRDEASGRACLILSPSKRFPVRTRQRTGTINHAEKTNNKTKTMRVKLLVQTQEFQSWPASKDRAASTSHNLVCVDMSQPADARMTESISYRLKDEEIPKHWDKSMDKIIEVNLRRIAHSKSGKASIIGEIVETTPAK